LIARRPVIAALVSLAAALPGSEARADGIELTHFSTQRSDEGLELSFGTRFDLARAVDDALHKGVPIYFVAEATVFRSRWYWRDARPARAERIWRLAWQPLTRQYRLSTGGLHQSYGVLEDALAALRTVSGWRIAEPPDIQDDGHYYLEFSFKLDVSQMPRPMQIGLGSQPGFSLSIEQKRAFNPDFSLK
jgi:hypothetical protein